MKSTLMKWTVIMALGLLLTGCQANESSNAEIANSLANTKQEENHHEHDHDHKHEHDDDENHNHEHNHEHNHDEEEEKIYKGYFEDNQVKLRTLSDWEGDWQSVYPYLLDSSLDEVFSHKEKTIGKMTALEYKDYYAIGYKTDTEQIIIEGNKVTFIKNGESYSGQYESDGYEILTYEAGNRGVRYIFKLVDVIEGLPKYIQFSDHHISPYNVDHYHLYWGDDRAALLEEVINWPTYYHSNLDGKSIASEMMVH